MGLNKVVGFSTAKFLKEKGFDKPTKANWWILAKDHSENYSKKLPVDESKIFFAKDSYELELKTQIDEDTEHNVYHVLLAPTIAEVVMWLYDNHKIYIHISPHGEEEDLLEDCKWWFSVYKNKLYNLVGGSKITKDIEDFGSLTEAYEAAIEYALNNLIWTNSLCLMK